MRIVAANGGPFTRRQALEAGYTSWAIRERVRTGRWVALRRGVYVERAFHDACKDDERRWCALRMAAAMVALGRADVVGSHHCAAVVHGLSQLTDRSDVLTLTRRPDVAGHRRRSADMVIHPAELPGGHVSTAASIRVTTPARTVVDLARSLPFRDAVVVADSALYRGSCDRAHLLQVVQDCAGWPGLDRARTVVDFAHRRARTPLESVARVMAAEQGLPEPEVGVYFGQTEEPFTEVDLYWRQHRTILLVDGWSKYDVNPARNRLEKHKQERLEEMGFMVVRLHWHDIMDKSAECAHRIRNAFARAHRVYGTAA